MKAVSRSALAGFGSPFLAQNDIPLPPEITSQEWNQRHVAGEDLFNTIVYPSGDKAVGQVCKIPGGSGIARSVSVDEYRKQGGWPTCEEIIDTATERLAGWAELTAEEWDALALEYQSEWEAADKKILRGVQAVVNGEFRAACWFPHGQRAQTSAGNPMDAAVQGVPTCEEIWDHICKIPEAEGGVAGHPECTQEAITFPPPEDEPPVDDGKPPVNGDRPPADGAPPTNGEPPTIPPEPDLTEGIAAGGILAAITGVIFLA